MDVIWTFFSDQLAENQFLSGGALLAVLGVGFAYLRNIPSYVYNWIRRRLVIRVDILDRDEAFSWLIAWLAQHPYKRRCRLVSVNTSNKDSKKSKNIILSPAPGPHFFFYKRRLVILRRSRQEGGDLKGGLLCIQEKFDLTIFSRNVSIVNSLLEEARDVANPVDNSSVKIYRADWTTWVLARKQPVRKLSSVILADNQQETLLEDLKDFQESEEWYASTGVPYRRGYLLYVPPGNGKSSVVIALASALNLNVCVLTLSAKGMGDETLMQLCSEPPPNSLILLEDIDCACVTRDGDDTDLTFSGLLNAIDGITATEGRIMFMTTNKQEKLDDALIRPGRCDISMKLDVATSDQASRLFLHFYPHLSERAESFGLENSGKSMAHIQGLLISDKNNPEVI